MRGWSASILPLSADARVSGPCRSAWWLRRARDAAVALERPALSTVAGCLHVAAIVVGMWQLYL
jgi:hypothetical protein